MQSVNINFLYYSKKNQQSIILLDQMEKLNLLQNFKLICVDNNLDKLPKLIKEIPTIVIPHQNRIFNTKESFDWIRGIFQMRQQPILQQRAKIMENIKKQAEIIPNNPMPFITEEFSGFSDKFAYNINENISQPKSFFNYGSENENKIFTAIVDNEKMTEQLAHSRERNLEGIRRKQDNEIERIIQEQYNDLVSKKK